MIRTHNPIPCHPNPYQLLNEEPLFTPPSQKTLVTWSNACIAEFQRHLPYIAYPANAQRLAHPWKTRRQEENRQGKQQHDTMIDLWLKYIQNPTEVLPPQHSYCWWPTNTVPQLPATIPQPQTIQQHMNHITPSTVSRRIQYLSHRNGRRTATIRSANEPTPCVLPSPATTSRPPHQIHYHLRQHIKHNHTKSSRVLQIPNHHAPLHPGTPPTPLWCDDNTLVYWSVVATADDFSLTA
jgi:hypothetical protein